MNVSTNAGIGQNHPVFVDAKRYYRRGYCSVDAALSDRAGYRLILADPLADPVGQVNAEMRLAAVEDMIEDVDRIARLQAGIPSSYDREYADWTRLAQLVRERTDLPDLIKELGITTIWKVSRNGTNWAGPCPICGGIDRWQVFNRGHGWWAWCRQCERSSDAIALVQSYATGCEHFRDAVAFLAERLGVVA